MTDDWRTQTWSRKESTWMEGYDATLRRIDDAVYRRMMIPQVGWMMGEGFTADRWERVRRQRELDRLRSEAYSKIQQLAEPRGYLT